MDYINPFDFKKVFLDLILEDPAILAFALVFVISYLAAKFNMSNNNFLLIIAISSIIMAGYMGQAIYIIILVVLGFVIFKSMAKVLQ